MAFCNRNKKANPEHLSPKLCIILQRYEFCDNYPTRFHPGRPLFSANPVMLLQITSLDFMLFKPKRMQSCTVASRRPWQYPFCRFTWPLLRLPKARTCVLRVENMDRKKSRCTGLLRIANNSTSRFDHFDFCDKETAILGHIL